MLHRRRGTTRAAIALCNRPPSPQPFQSLAFLPFYIYPNITQHPPSSFFYTLQRPTTSHRFPQPSPTSTIMCITYFKDSRYLCGHKAPASQARSEPVVCKSMLFMRQHSKFELGSICPVTEQRLHRLPSPCEKCMTNGDYLQSSDDGSWAQSPRLVAGINRICPWSTGPIYADVVSIS